MILGFVLLLCSYNVDVPSNEKDVHSWMNSQTVEDKQVQRLSAFYYARDLEKQGKSKQALEVLQKIEVKDDPLGIAITFHSARLRLLEKQPAWQASLDIFKGKPGPKLRWGISRADEAQALLLLAHSYDEHSQAAFDIIKHLALEYPRWQVAIPGMTREELEKRAANLLRDMDYQQSLELYDNLIATAQGTEKQRLQRVAAWIITEKLRDRFGQAEQLYNEIVNVGSEQRDQDLMYLAYIQGKIDPKKSKATYQKFLEQFPEHKEAEKALFFFVWTDFDLEQFQAAIDGFTHFLDKYPNGNYKEPAYWYRALSYLRMNNMVQAAADMQKISSHPSYTERAGYWLAKIQLQLGQVNEAHKRLLEISQKAPLSYYGQLSRLLLPEEQRPQLLLPAARYSGCAVLADPNMNKIPRAVREGIEQSVTYAKLGLYQLAQETFTHYSSSKELTLSQRQMLKGLRPLVAHYRKDILDRSMANCRNALDYRPTNKKVKKLWERYYPMAYANIIEQQEDKLPSKVLWSIMRQESLYTPQARSHADALGLIQVVPQVGRKASARLEESFEPYNLYRPAYNIKIAGEALSYRMTRYQGKIPLVLMSYNATPYHAEKWLRQNQDLPYDLFVEEIPYLETRNYVKRITAHLLHYALLENPTLKEPWIEIGLPEPTDIVKDTFGQVITRLGLKSDSQEKVVMGTCSNCIPKRFD